MELNNKEKNVSSLIEETYSITRDEYLESMRLYASQFKKYRILFLLLVGIFVISQLYSVKFTIYSWVTFLITSITFVLIFKILTHFQRKRIEEKCLASRKLTFTENGLEAQTQNGHSFFKYSAFEKYQSNRNMGLLYMSKRMFYILPFRVFNQEELEKLLKEQNIIKE